MTGVKAREEASVIQETITSSYCTLLWSQPVQSALLTSYLFFSVLIICIRREILDDIGAPVACWVIESAELASNVVHLRQLAWTAC